MSRLRKEIQNLEAELKEYLEFSRLIQKVKFYSRDNYLSLEYKPFNHEGIKQIISNCYKETLEKILKNNDKIQRVEEEEINGETYIKRLILKPMKKSEKFIISYRILCDLKKQVNNYFLRHAEEIDKYKKMIEKRCKI